MSNVKNRKKEKSETCLSFLRSNFLCFLPNTGYRCFFFIVFVSLKYSFRDLFLRNFKFAKNAVAVNAASFVCYELPQRNCRLKR